MKRTISDVNVAGQRVLMRVDFNVPLSDDGQITDDRRIVMALESIRSVIDRGGKLILMSHLGRPKGSPDPAFSLRPTAVRLAQLLERSVGFSEDCIGTDADNLIASMKDGDVVMLENLRFHAAENLIDKAEKRGESPTSDERAKIDAFAKAIAKNADIYCNNAFGTCHREHVSMFDVPKLMPTGKRVVGHLVERELRFLGEALSNPNRPFFAILGGAKVSDKIGVIRNLLPKVDGILIGGAMAYTFLKAKGTDIGSSLCEMDKLDLANELLSQADGKIHLPIDSVCAKKLEASTETKVYKGAIEEGWMGLDIGPEASADYVNTLVSARTVVWNGPMGVFETPPFDRGTLDVANALAKATENGATTIIGGGDSASAVEKSGLSAKMTHISTGGGASLEFLEGRPFATIEILDDA